MLGCDRISCGWNVWLTPRQTRIIYAKLMGQPIRPEDEEHLPRLVEWFEHEAQARRELTGA